MASHRIFKKPKGSFFLFGPRATGKSTWLKNQVNPDLMIDLLKTQDFRRFSVDLNLLREILDANPDYKIVVIDEVQKLPSILDEVHSLIFESDNSIQFILTGSSARKLKKNNINLLAGRALVRHFHAFSYMEISSKFKLEKALKFGMLPQVWNLESDEDKKDYLTAYVETYLKEEIQQEAAVRSLPSYLLFLEHFALRNAQVINMQSLSGEIGVARTTMNGYLEIIEQTLLGMRLLPIHLKAKVKEVSLAKFYFFDPGVVRSLSRQLDSEIKDEKGALLETYVLHELKTYSDYYQKRWEFYYWGTPSENEVDFIIVSGDRKVGVEVKSSTAWKAEYNKGLNTLLDAKKINDAYGVYGGKEIIKKERVTVFPVIEFIKFIHKNKLI